MGTPLSPRVDYADIQGDILRAYGNDYKRTSYMLTPPRTGQRGTDMAERTAG
jgi:hypothetical protein